MKRILIFGAIIAAAGCEKVDTGTNPSESGADMSKYVAMGTSISMGFASDGVVSSSQQSSWPRLLANDAGVTFTLPLIDSPGCPVPFASPLGSLKRIDNSSVLLTSTTCAPNSAGVVLPTQNVSVTGQTTTEAVSSTPSANTPAARVLANGQTQVTAMRAQNPTFVSVELGANEIFPALGGLVQSGVTTVPFATFSASYQTVIDNVKASGAQALLVLLPSDVTKFPALRTGPEIASQRTAFALLNVSVNANCDASTNYISVLKLTSALASGAARAAQFLGPFDLSCADGVGEDGVLTTSDIATLNSLIAQMNAFITTKATENGYATFSLGALYDTVKDGVTFNLGTIFTSDTPWGPKMSLDAVHPSAAGNEVLATAAKAAIVAKYGGIIRL
ncbi:MAG: SGNH/GDSL hydrolase family protein [Gemmatimonas sp.]